MQKSVKILLLLAVILVISLIAKSLIAANRLQIEDISDLLPRNGQYPTRSLASIKTVVIHHSGVEGQTAWDYALYHVNSNSWPGIGYHYVIEKNGSVKQTNPLTNASYHVAAHNAYTIGISLSGNFNQTQATQAQISSLKKLLSHLSSLLARDFNVVGHRDLGNTTCPGHNFYPLIDSLWQ
ncbi:MAG: peptidoglycan recognition family protein [Bacteroidota bacterium]